MRIFFSKAGFIAALAAVVLIIGCEQKRNEPFKSVTTSIRVLEKDQSDDFAKQWIIGSNSDVDGMEQIRIEVENEMVWNLIEANRDYVVGYQGSQENGYVLQQIDTLIESESETK